MQALKKVRSYVVLLFICSLLTATSLVSCGKGEAAREETTEHPGEKKDEHPKAGAESEHPRNDSTKVEGAQP